MIGQFVLTNNNDQKLKPISTFNKLDTIPEKTKELSETRLKKLNVYFDACV